MAKSPLQSRVKNLNQVVNCAAGSFGRLRPGATVAQREGHRYIERMAAPERIDSLMTTDIQTSQRAATVTLRERRLEAMNDRRVTM